MITDKRGLVAVVTASSEGPRVNFVGRTYRDQSRLRSLYVALRIVTSVYAKRSGDAGDLSFPVCVWIQERPGRWEQV